MIILAIFATIVAVLVVLSLFVVMADAYFVSDVTCSLFGGATWSELKWNTLKKDLEDIEPVWLRKVAQYTTADTWGVPFFYAFYWVFRGYRSLYNRYSDNLDHISFRMTRK